MTLAQKENEYIKILFTGFPGGLDKEWTSKLYKNSSNENWTSRDLYSVKTHFIVRYRSHLLSCAYKSFALLLLSYKLASILIEL